MLNKLEFSNQDELCEAVVESAIALIAQAHRDGRQFHLALTGGEAGGLVAQLLAERVNENPDNYVGLHVWWSDERFVPQASSERNSYSFMNSLAVDGVVHIHESAASDSNIDVSTAARRYAVDVSGFDMDLTLLSIGTDGHVASLFPGMWQKEDPSPVVSVLNAPKNPPQRVTFTIAKINSSARVWLLASGEAKREIISRVISGDTSLPATLVSGRQETTLFTDS